MSHYIPKSGCQKYTPSVWNAPHSVIINNLLPWLRKHIQALSFYDPSCFLVTSPLCFILKLLWTRNPKVFISKRPPFLHWYSLLVFEQPTFDVTNRCQPFHHFHRVSFFQLLIPVFSLWLSMYMFVVLCFVTNSKTNIGCLVADIIVTIIEWFCCLRQLTTFQVYIK